MFGVYADELLVELKKLGVGCHVAGVFMGALRFCDDLLLLAPTRDAMQIMMDTNQRFAGKYDLQFSTDPNPRRVRPNASLCVTGRLLRRSQYPDLGWDATSLGGVNCSLGPRPALFWQHGE